jgi:hypothetical protein
MNGALEETAEVRLTPGAPNPRGRRKTQEEGHHGPQPGQLPDDREYARFALHQCAHEDADDRADEEHGAGRDRSHAAPGDSPRPSAGAGEGERRIAADRQEPRDEDELDEPNLREEGDGEGGNGQVGDAAADLHPARCAAEIVDQPQHGVRRQVEKQDQHDRDDRRLVDPGERADTIEHDHRGDRAEQKDGVEARPGPPSKAVPEHHDEEPDEQDLGDEADELEGGHWNSGTRLRRN